MELAEIGRDIREARRAAGMTQQRLSDLSGVSRLRIGQIETGKAYDVMFSSLRDILTALDLDIRTRTLNSGRPVYEELLEDSAMNDAMQADGP